MEVEFMPVLDCSVKNCYYNREKKCCLDGIHVEGDNVNDPEETACGSFKSQDEGSYTSACHCGMAPENKLRVQCEAETCTFNDDKMCAANHIGIEGNGAKTYGETECGSFRLEE